MKKENVLVLMMSILLLGFSFPTHSWSLTLPPPGEYIPGSADDGDPPYPIYYSVTYGDFQSYSLSLLAIGYDIVNGGGTGPGNPFYVNSTPGAIKDDIVIYTGTSSQPATTNDPGMDGAYPTPSGQGYTTFDTAATPDPGGAGQFAGDSSGSWDITLAALTNYLQGSPLLFFFNNNEENSAEDQSVKGKAEVSIVKADGSLWNGLQFRFDDGSGGEAESLGKLDIPWASYGLPDYGTVNQNLGANQAAFVINSVELDTFLDRWVAGDYADAVAMQVRFQLSDLSNGYEQLFIQRGDRAPNTNTIPEPATLLLLGFGLLGLAGVNRKKK